MFMVLTAYAAAISSWTSTLSEVYNGRFLMAIFFYQHIMKGFVLMYTYTSLEFMLRDYNTPAPRMQVLKTVALLPWALKPLLGLMSDTVPLCGYRRAPYIAASTVMGIAAFTAVGVQGVLLPLNVTVACFFAMFVQITTCDLLMEAATAEKIRHIPEHGPSLMSFVAGGITLAMLAATLTIGIVLDRLGSSGPCSLCVLPSVMMLVPVLANFLGEEPQSQTSLSARRQAFFSQMEILVLVLVMALCSLLLLAVGLGSPSVMIQFELVLAVAIVVICAFTGLLTPVIGRMNTFFFIQSISAISIEGGRFYFFTDDTQSFPGGPHFSVWFYTTGIGLVASCCGLLALGIYNRWMKNWRYRSVFILSNFLWCVVSAISVLVFTRQNLALGIPDRIFVLGGTALQNAFEQWLYVPASILLSQLCPSGMEATMFALLAGCQNLGRAVASYFGSFLLTYLAVSPHGAAHEEKQFDDFWKAVVFQALSPLATLWLVPIMIPDALQTESIVSSESTATKGSPWLQLIGDAGMETPHHDMLEVLGDNGSTRQQYSTFDLSGTGGSSSCLESES